MSDEFSLNDPVAAVADPSTETSVLHDIAERFPELRVAVAAHPHAQEELLNWLDQLGDPAVSWVVAQRRTAGGDGKETASMHPLDPAYEPSRAGSVHDESMTANKEIYAGVTEEPQGSSHANEKQPESAVRNWVDDGGNNLVPPVELARTQVQRTSIFPVSVQSDAPLHGSTETEATTILPATNQEPQLMPVHPPQVSMNPGDQIASGQGHEPSKNQKSKGLIAALVFLIVLALALVCAVAYVFTNGFGTIGNTTSQVVTADSEKSEPGVDGRGGTGGEGSSDTQPQSSNTEETVRYPAPADAVRMGSFSAPSGNIHCEISETGARCQILQNEWVGTAYDVCPGLDGGAIKVDSTSVGSDCSGPVAPGTTLAYGSYATSGDYACSSTSDGISCWNIRTGRAFALARGGWMRGTTGNIPPQDFSW